MSKKSKPGDGQRPKGVKGALADADHQRPTRFLGDLIKGLRKLRRR